MAEEPAKDVAGQNKYVDKITEILEKVKPRKAYWKDSARALATIEKYVNGILKGYKVSVRPFGSYLQKTAMKGSDVDLALIFEGVFEFDNDKNDESRAAKALRVKLLKELSEKFKSQSYSLTVIEEVLSAKVPILRVQFQERNSEPLDIDLSIGKWSTGNPDIIIGEILATNEVVLDVYYLLKNWVKCRLACPDASPAFFGLLNSFSWVLLFIYHNIQLGHLPAYKNIECYEPLIPLERENILDNLESFFDFLYLVHQDVHRAQRKISVYEGVLVPLNFAESKAQKKGEVLFVEDPDRRDNNAARCCAPAGWQKIIEEVIRAKVMLKHRECKDHIDKLFAKTVVDVSSLRNGNAFGHGKRARDQIQDEQKWKKTRTATW